MLHVTASVTNLQKQNDQSQRARTKPGALWFEFAYLLNNIISVNTHTHTADLCSRIRSVTMW